MYKNRSQICAPRRAMNFYLMAFNALFFVTVFFFPDQVQIPKGRNFFLSQLLHFLHAILRILSVTPVEKMAVAYTGILDNT